MRKSRCEEPRGFAFLLLLVLISSEAGPVLTTGCWEKIELALKISVTSALKSLNYRRERSAGVSWIQRWARKKFSSSERK